MGTKIKKTLPNQHKNVESLITLSGTNPRGFE